MEAKKKENIFRRLRPVRTFWSAAAVVLTLAALTGCQGISTGKPAAQGSQDQLTGGLTATPTTVSFGNVQVGTSQSQSATVSNTGSATVNVTDATITGTGFSTTGLTTPLALSPGQSATFNVVFSPQAAGSVSGNLALTNDSSTSPVNIALSATAVTPGSPAQLQVSPTTINVGSVTAGTSGTQTGTLTATGGSITVSSVSVGGSEFAVSGMPVTIPAGQSANFTVTFTPQSSGAASETATFTSNASNTAVATLTGTGVAAPVHTVNLTWDASASPNVVGYNVYRRTGTTGGFAQINTVLDTLTAYTDSSVVDGQTYYYETTAMNSSNEESAPSAAVKAVIPSP